MNKKQKYRKIENVGADSLWSRLSNKKSSKGGKTIQQILGIEGEGPEPLGGKPLKMMDIVNSMYDNGEEYEEEN